MKKNFIKKLLIGGLVTSVCLCCCFINIKNYVFASSSNQYQSENNWFNGSTPLPEYFTDINELKGKTFTIDAYTLLTLSQFEMLDIYINILERDYIGIEINNETHETIECVDYLQYPYVIYERLGDYGPEYSLFSLYLEDSSNYPCIYINDVALNGSANIQLTGSSVFYNNNYAYLPVNNIQSRYDVPLGLYSITTINNRTYFLNYSNFDFLTEIQFLSNIGSYDFQYQYLNFYFVFPNSDRYSLGFNPSEYIGIFDIFTYIQPYNANISDKINYGIIEYNNGYNKGFLDGEASALDNTYRFTFLTGIFNGISDLLAIEIFPNVQLGYFIFVPLALGITGMIFWFWRKD